MVLVFLQLAQFFFSDDKLGAEIHPTDSVLNERVYSQSEIFITRLDLMSVCGRILPGGGNK